MSVSNKQLREGIIAKLKDYEAYVDNELPDYIMVMLANNKTVHQINNDLQLFLGENTDRFTTWLQRAISDPIALGERETNEGRKESVKAAAGTKRKRESTPLLDELENYPEEEEREEGEATSPPRRAVPVRKEKERERGEEDESGPTKLARTREGEELKGRGQRSSIAKKIIKVLQPDSTRDQDLRELIAQRRKEKPHHRGGGSRHHRQDGSDGEIADGFEEEEEEEGREGKGQKSSMSSVVKMVHTERPHRTDKGGSRLLHRAILGIKSGEKRSSKSREPTSSSGSRGSSSKRRSDIPTRTKGFSTSKHSSTADQSTAILIGESDGDGEAREGSEGVEEVLVEVDGEGDMVDEFRREQQLEKTEKKLFKDAVEKSTIAAVQKVLPLGGRLKLTDVRSRLGRVQRSLVAAGIGKGGRGERRESEEDEEEDEEADLRDLLNKKKEKNSESTTRFVVTLTGAGDDFAKAASSDLEEEEEEEEKEGLRKAEKKAARVSALSRLSRFNSQAVEEAMVEGEEDAKENMEEDYEEDNSGGRGLGGLPERCRFWPNCKNGDSCSFHHPSVPCRLFPNCKYGNKCHFVHPQCKFDARCTRADCPYLHTAPRHLSMSFPSPVVAPPPAPMIAPPIFSPFTSGFSFGRMSPWKQPRPQRYPSKSALSWTPGVKGGHISERQFAVPEDQSTALPV